MAGIQDFISLASGQLGIGQDKAQSATKGVLQTLQGQADGPDFSKFLSALPGAADLLKGGAQWQRRRRWRRLMGSLGGLMGGGGDLGGLMGSSVALGGKSGGRWHPRRAQSGGRRRQGASSSRCSSSSRKEKVGPAVLQAVWRSAEPRIPCQQPVSIRLPVASRDVGLQPPAPWRSLRCSTGQLAPELARPRTAAGSPRRIRHRSTTPTGCWPHGRPDNGGWLPEARQATDFCSKGAPE
jgi:hypothetical protein